MARKKEVHFFLICLGLTLTLFLTLSSCRKQPKKTPDFFNLIEDFHVAKTVKQTDKIDFRKKSVRDFLLNGWSKTEGKGTWADSLTSELKFYTFFAPKDLKVQLNCSPFSYPGSPPQYITLFLNKNYIDQQEITNKGISSTFLLPRQYLQKGENILTFKFNYAKSPAEVLGEKDNRTLAVLFETLDFIDHKISSKNIFRKENSIFLNPLSQLNYFYKLPKGAHLLFELERPSSDSSKLKGLKLDLLIQKDQDKEKKILEIDLNSSPAKNNYDIDLTDFEEEIVCLKFRFDLPANLDESEIAPFYVQLTRAEIKGSKKLDSQENDFTWFHNKKKSLSKTNLIIAVLDAVNYRHMSCYGYERQTTPFIDHLAEEGFIFTRAYAHASWTIPSITSLFTSIYPISHQVWSMERKLSDKALCLAEILRKKDFATCAITASAPASNVFNLLQGFKTTYELFEEKEENLKSKRRKRVVWAEDFLEPGLDWLKKHQDQQFFMYLHFLQPHEPYNPPKPFRDKFGQVYNSQLKEKKHLKPGNLDKQKLTKTDLDYLKAAYDENLNYADFYLGKFLEGLKNIGIYDNTILVITADHGEGFFEHGSIGHSKTLYEEEVHIPLIIHFPGKFNSGPKKIDALVQIIDLMPTFLDIYGPENIKQSFQGKSLIPLLFGKKQEINDFALFSLSQPFVEDETRAFGLVDKRYKIIITKTEELLFDLANDPQEKDNIYFKNPVLSGYYRQKLLKLNSEYMGKHDLAIRGKYILDKKTRRRLRALGYLK